MNSFTNLLRSFFPLEGTTFIHCTAATENKFLLVKTKRKEIAQLHSETLITSVTETVAILS